MHRSPSFEGTSISRLINIKPGEVVKYGTTREKSGYVMHQAWMLYLQKRAMLFQRRLGKGESASYEYYAVGVTTSQLDALEAAARRTHVAQWRSSVSRKART